MSFEAGYRPRACGMQAERKAHHVHHLPAPPSRVGCVPTHRCRGRVGGGRPHRRNPRSAVQRRSPDRRRPAADRRLRRVRAPQWLRDVDHRPGRGSNLPVHPAIRRRRLVRHHLAIPDGAWRTREVHSGQHGQHRPHERGRGHGLLRRGGEHGLIDGQSGRRLRDGRHGQPEPRALDRLLGIPRGDRSRRRTARSIGRLPGLVQALGRTRCPEQPRAAHLATAGPTTTKAHPKSSTRGGRTAVSRCSLAQPAAAAGRIAASKNGRPPSISIRRTDRSWPA